MKMPSLLLTAAALTLAAGVASAAPNHEVQAFLVQAQSQAEAKLAAAGVDLTGRTVSVRAHIAGDGGLGAPHVVGSTGSRDADYRVEQALRGLRIEDVPPALIGADLTLALGHADVVQAKAR